MKKVPQVGDTFNVGTNLQHYAARNVGEPRVPVHIGPGVKPDWPDEAQHIVTVTGSERLEKPDAEGRTYKITQRCACGMEWSYNR